MCLLTNAEERPNENKSPILYDSFWNSLLNEKFFFFPCFPPSFFLAAAYIFISEYTQTKFFFLKQWMRFSDFFSENRVGLVWRELSTVVSIWLTLSILYFSFSLYLYKSRELLEELLSFFFIPDGLDEISR